MNVQLLPASASHDQVLTRLLQLYCYDFSELISLDVADDGLFHHGLSFNEPYSHRYLVQVDGRIAGFVVLDERSRLTGDPDIMDVSQFFVMRKYRRQGVGAECAVQAFALFPRRWEVRQVVSNVTATAFWRRVIADYTGDRFEQTLHDDERWRGPVQRFDARKT